MISFKRLFRELNSGSLAQYYQFRREHTNRVIEQEAIIHMQSLLTLYVLDREEKDEEQK